LRLKLTRSEQRIIEWLAAQRSSVARRRNIKDARIGPQDSEQIDIDGLKGEFAFAKMFNLWPDLQVGERLLHDVITPLGGVDVKATRYRSGRLLATRKKQTIPADWYALMWLEDDETIHCLGLAKGVDLLQDSNLRDLGRGVGYAMEQADLLQPSEFQRMINKAFH
jgi:hypothetical protein